MLALFFLILSTIFCMEKIAFIINPIAGGYCKHALEKRIVRDFSREYGFNYEICRTAAAGDAAAMSARLAQCGFAKIVVVGGDGTMNEAASGLLHTNAAMGIVPCGSGNGLARHLGLPMNHLQALNYVKTASIRKMDACKINGKLFFCTAGVGFDALVGSKFAEYGRRGIMGYIRIIAREIALYRSETYRITLDGTTIEREAFLVTFANAAQWGNNGWIAPHADISDGLLDVVIVKPFAWYKLPPLCTGLLSKRIDHAREVEIFRCHSAVLERTNAGYAHYDGEPALLDAKIEVSIIPHALTILC
jgi:YegS/Rv2252/BmrU family lipid kinase